MNQICRDIFRAIHEGKWLKIEYRNKADQITKYWIGIRDLDPAKRTLKVDGLHLGMYTLGELVLCQDLVQVKMRNFSPF